MLGICRLCDQQDTLCKSHIVPNSFVKRIKDGDPQLVAVVVKESPKARKTNGDVTKYLLCSACEQLLERSYEKYGTRLFVETAEIHETSTHVLFTKFDYEKYFLFVVSILWRASVSGLKEYEPLVGLADLSAGFKSCLRKNTIFSEHFGIRIDKFIKLSILKVVDDSGLIPQSALDNLLLALNLEKGKTVDDGLHFYLMVDGFLLVAHFFPLRSPLLANWLPSGRVTGRRFLKVPKVPFSELSQVHQSINAAITAFGGEE